jgi:long-chain acyl-CoA synthetase
MMLRFGPARLADYARQLRYLELGSAPMPLQDKLRLMELLPRSRICMHYGLTEATRSAFIEFHGESGRLHSIGRPSHGVEFRIVGQQGTIAAVGVHGEIQIRGPHVMRTYWEDAERTNEAFMDGWLRTGDVGHADEDGYLYLHGRNADLINVGGRKVSPTEVEEVLRSHPAVLDCGCTGISDPAGVSGEAVAVLVLLRKGQESSKRELRVFLRGRLEPYKLPIKWSFSGVLPRTVNGKLQRHLLREQLETQGD